MHTACEQICYSVLHQSCFRKTAVLFLARSWWVIDQHPHYYLKFHGQDIFVLSIHWHLFFDFFFFFSTILVLTLLLTSIFFNFTLQWEIGQQAVNGSLLYNYYICNVEEREQDNWLRTTFIQRNPAASRVFVELQFVVRDCNSFNADSLTCKETFNLYTSEADADIGTAFRKGLFRKVATIAPDEISGVGEMKMNTETKVVDNLSRKGFYLGFQDIGACVAIYSVRVYYKTCPATVQSLAAFPETVAGGENQALREVAGSCVKNAVSEGQPRIYCTTDGEWVVPMSQCQCKPGFEAFEDTCQGKTYVSLFAFHR